jgi:hypothetical protein
VQGSSTAATTAAAGLGRELFVNALQEAKKGGILQ